MVHAGPSAPVSSVMDLWGQQPFLGGRAVLHRTWSCVPGLYAEISGVPPSREPRVSPNVSSVPCGVPLPSVGHVWCKGREGTPRAQVPTLNPGLTNLGSFTARDPCTRGDAENSLANEAASFHPVLEAASPIAIFSLGSESRGVAVRGGSPALFHRGALLSPRTSRPEFGTMGCSRGSCLVLGKVSTSGGTSAEPPVAAPTQFTAPTQ